ncbi:23S rRNA (adenine(2030)-N(6))-methyltransferase RlmJ [Igneacidithiobacillus siniensis]|uniref:23S rRNA (adenine(2030)-N(6))-methyltransferase RlmJ n=1 Tax=Acidithiobacillus TaxID=119977 RepID=UPI002010926D|nr:23S rRNA (adenine(2030)-N(6))-methyltransferase RlmJ [Acidithiobacillus sp. S30A2]
MTNARAQAKRIGLPLFPLAAECRTIRDMNYRHQFHAGNAADCMKHLALVLALEQLLQKDRALYYVDTHAGAGRYDLGQTAEAEMGIKRLWPQRRALLELRPWLDLLLAENSGKELHSYLGSPLLAARLLRPQDMIFLLEKVPGIAQELRQSLAARPQSSVLVEDGYQFLQRKAPPAPGRGLVLVDPPFEAVGEWEQLADSLLAAQQNWPQASFLVWYPVKIRGKISRLGQRLQAQTAVQTVELLWEEESGPERLIGSGLALIRPLWGFSERFLAALGRMAPQLAPAGGWSLQMRDLAQRGSRPQNDQQRLGNRRK